MEADPTVLVMGAPQHATCITGLSALSLCMCIQSRRSSSVPSSANGQGCAGEDVGHYGGSYKVTYDLYKKYGEMRLLDTPICGETALLFICSSSVLERRCTVFRLSFTP